MTGAEGETGVAGPLIVPLVDEAAGYPVAVTPLVQPGAVDPTRVIDVRQASEHAAGHLPCARPVKLGALARAADGDHGPVAVMCGHGERAATAASVLERLGQREVTIVAGGPADWARATGRPLAVA